MTRPEPRYRAGMRVAHAAFGDGVVLESELDREDEIVTIQFPVGVKRLAASLAPLDILADSVPDRHRSSGDDA